MPIADILKHREAFCYYGISGNERHIDKRVYHVNSANIGLFDRVELGYDNDFEGNTVLNVKLSLYESTKADYGLSAGFTNVDTKNKYVEPYVVGRYGFGNGLRLHAGTIRTDRWRVMIGADYAVGNDWLLAADWQSGPNGAVWAGATYNIAKIPGLSVSAFVGFPSVRSDGIQHQLLVNYAFRF